MTGVDLPTYMVEELQRIIENAFKPIHERLDLIEQSQRRPDQNFLQSIRRPRRGLMKEEKSYEEEFENASRQFYSCKKRRDEARDHENIKLKNIPSIQKKHDHKSYLGGEWDNWIYEENQSLPMQQLEDTVTLNQTSHRLNPKKMNVEVEVVAYINEEACLNPKELVEVDREVDVKDDESTPKLLKLKDSSDEVLEESTPTTLEAKALTQAKGVEKEQPIDKKEIGFMQKSFLARACDWMWAVKEERLIIVLRFKVQEKSELEPKKKNNAQGRKAMVQQSINARNENLIFDPGIWIDDLDLRTNPFQEEGNDACHGGPSYVAYVG